MYMYNTLGWQMVNARLCKKTSLVFFFGSLRHFDFLNCETKNSKLKTFRL